jgi:signal peptide peptidase SppA
MRFEGITRAVYFDPWLITEAGHASIVEMLKLLGAVAVDRTGTGACGEAVPVPQMKVEEGVAIIPVLGPIGRRLPEFVKGAGYVDSADIIADAREAEANPAVHTIVFDIDSPGGMVNGTPEAASAIHGLTKPTYAYTGGVMASGAYWLAAAAKYILAAPSACIGSIGVYLPIIDQSKQMEMAGLAVDLIKDGKFKGMGFPGTTLTEEQRGQLQAGVNRIGVDFREWVTSNRKYVLKEDMQGQVFGAKEAFDKGLIDGVTTDWRADLERQRAMPGYLSLFAKGKNE